MITLERIRGMKITDLAALGEAGLDPNGLAERTALITAKMIFEDGFFHADPASTAVVDRARLREDLAGLLARQFGRSIAEISLRVALGEVLDIARRHRLRVPRDLSSLFTMLIIAEGVVADVDPEFRFAEALAPYARRQLLSGLTGPDAWRRLEQFGIDLAELTAELPTRLNPSPRRSRPVGSRSICAPMKWTRCSPASSTSVTASRRARSPLR